VKDKGCHSGYNEEWQSWDVDEDKVSSLFCSCSVHSGHTDRVRSMYVAAVG